MNKLISVGFILLLVSCARGPGPNAGEFGSSFLWLDPENEDDIDPEITSCTDEINFNPLSIRTDEDVEPYLAYSVDDDGEDWTLINCDEADFGDVRDGEFAFSDCEENTDGFDNSGIDGNELTGEISGETPFDGVDCTQTQTTSISAQDNGATLTVAFAISFSLAGADCDAIEAEFEARSGNGEGIDGCEVAYNFPDFETLAVVGE